MLKKIVFMAVLGIGVQGLTGVSYAHTHGDGQPQPGNLKIIENKGQWGTQAKYRAEISYGAMYLTDGGFVYNFSSSEDYAKIDKVLHDEKKADVDVSGMIIRNHAYKVNFLGANTDIRYVPAEKNVTKFNYFIGTDPSKWVSGAAVYGAVTQQNVYNGIDVKVYSSDHSLKYDVVVAPQADPSLVRLQFEGVKPVLNAKGDLIVRTSVNEVVEKAPYTYQVVEGREVEVPSRYRLNGNILSFEFPQGYDKSLPLIIDPNLLFVNFSGASTGTFYAHSTAYDLDGNTITGALSSNGAGWPTTVGAYNTTFGTGNTACIHKYNADGSALVFGTYIGAGTGGGMLPNTIRSDAQGRIYFGGSTTNATLPITSGAYQPTIGGGADIYLALLSADGSTLLASTYLGGSGHEGSQMNTTTAFTALGSQTTSLTPTDIAVDGDGNVWVASNTGSANFPVTSNAYQSTLTGSHDVTLTKLSPDLTTLLYSTFLGGTGWDGATSVEFDATRNYIGISGFTNSPNFPTSQGAYHTTARGGVDGLLALFDVNSSSYVASTYLGTSAEDFAARIAFDCAGNVFATGRTQGNYPITATGSFVVPNGFIFIDKLTPGLTASMASTRTGAAHTSIVPSAMMVDVCGNILVATIVNNTSQLNMPLTPDAFETTPRAFYFAAFAPDFSDLVFGSYFGSTGNQDHFHPGICRIDPAGVIYHAVCSPTSGANWAPNRTAHAVHPDKLNGTTNDNVTFKFDFEAFSVKVTGETPEGGNVNQNHAIRGCKSAYLHYKRGKADTFDLVLRLQILGDAINGVDYVFLADSLVIPANDTVATLEIKALLANPATGPRRVIVNTMAPCACDGNRDNIMSSDTVLILDSVYVKMLTPLDTTCPGDQITIQAEIDPTLDFFWTPANLIPDATGLTITPSPVLTTFFTIEASQPGAPSTCPPRRATYMAYVEPYPEINVPNNYLTVCYRDSVGLTMQVTPDLPGYIYEWSPSQYIAAPNNASIKFLAPVGLYKLYMNVKTPGAGCSATDSMMINVVPPLTLEGIEPKDTLIRYGDDIQLRAVGEDAVMWTWSPLDYIRDAMLPVITVKPERDMVYSVRAWDQYGCFADDEAKVRVYHQPRIFVPNAFSPNGDGLNDVFKIENMTYERLISFKVFNRLGEVVFETIDPNKGWDGTNKAGKALASDVYYYYIQISGPTEETKNIEYKGDVTLIR